MPSMHTPAPWIVEPCVRADWAGSCNVVMGDARLLKLTPADAALIAAAPDMLSALEAAEYWLEEHNAHPSEPVTADDILRVIRAAITAAKG